MTAGRLAIVGLCGFLASCGSAAPARVAVAPTTTTSSSLLPTTFAVSIPPRRAAPPQELAGPSPQPNQFPIDIEQSNERVGAQLHHRTGGPYLSEPDIRARAEKLAMCQPTQSTPEARCDSTFVKFFSTYEEAYRSYGPPSWMYIGGFGHDREVYLVTVYGAMPWCPKTTMRDVHCPLYRDHFNELLDATTGAPQ